MAIPGHGSCDWQCHCEKRPRKYLLAWHGTELSWLVATKTRNSLKVKACRFYLGFLCSRVGLPPLGALSLCGMFGHNPEDLKILAWPKFPGGASFISITALAPVLLSYFSPPPMPHTIIHTTEKELRDMGGFPRFSVGCWIPDSGRDPISKVVIPCNRRLQNRSLS